MSAPSTFASERDGDDEGADEVEEDKDEDGSGLTVKASLMGSFLSFAGCCDLELD